MTVTTRGSRRSAAAPPAPRRRLRADERRRQLLETAARLVAEQGLDVVTMERLAEYAGVSKALVYLHFDNSAEILLELMRRETAELDAAAADRLRHARTFRDQISALIDPYLDAFDRPDSLFRALVVERSNRELLEEWRAERQRGLVTFLSGVIQSGFRIDPDDAELAAATLLGAFEAAANHAWLSGGSLNRRHVERVVHAVTQGGLTALGKPRRPVR